MARNAVKQVTAATTENIKKKSIAVAPNNLSERGVQPGAIKKMLTDPIFGIDNSVLAELKRIINEINDNVQAGLFLENTDTNKTVLSSDDMLNLVTEEDFIELMDQFINNLVLLSEGNTITVPDNDTVTYAIRYETTTNEIILSGSDGSVSKANLTTFMDAVNTINNEITNILSSIDSLDSRVTNLEENGVTSGGGGSTSIVVDAQMSSTSRNPVQNKVINAKFEEQNGRIDDISDNVDTAVKKANSASNTANSFDSSIKNIENEIKNIKDSLDNNSAGSTVDLQNYYTKDATYSKAEANENFAKSTDYDTFVNRVNPILNDLQNFQSTQETLNSNIDKRIEKLEGSSSGSGAASSNSNVVRIFVGESTLSDFDNFDVTNGGFILFYGYLEDQEYDGKFQMIIPLTQKFIDGTYGSYGLSKSIMVYGNINGEGTEINISVDGINNSFRGFQSSNCYVSEAYHIY